jgi:hypothetical protein
LTPALLIEPELSVPLKVIDPTTVVVVVAVAVVVVEAVVVVVVVAVWVSLPQPPTKDPKHKIPDPNNIPIIK